MKRKNIILGFLALAALTTGATMAGAETHSAHVQKTLAVGGVELLTLRAESESELGKRYEILEDRLVTILADANLRPGDVRIRHTTAGYAIYVKQNLLLTVTPQDSAYNETTPQQQASTWRNQLAKTLPQVKVATPAMR